MNTTGRPLKYDDPQIMQSRIDDYFKSCKEEKKRPTVPGLALYLDFSTRQALWEYTNRNKFGGDEEKAKIFYDTIKKALLRIEEDRVSQLISGNGNVAGQIFDLKNNFGYKDRQEVDHNQHITIVPAKIDKPKNAGKGSE